MKVYFTRHAIKRMVRVPWWNLCELRREVLLAVSAREKQNPLLEGRRVKLTRGICFFVVKKENGTIVVLTLGVVRSRYG